MARGDQLARQWKIIQSLISSRRGKSASDLAEVLECHTRTVYRDLEALQAAGFPVFTNVIGGKSIWSLLDTAKNSMPIPLNLTELMALYFSRGMMGALKGTVLYESLESLFDKIKTTLPPPYLKYLGQMENSLRISTKPTKHYGKLRDTIERISDAVIQKEVIEIVYYTMSRQKETRRKVAPYKIWFFDATFYLVGNCGLRDDVRIFALDRIKAIRNTDETFDMPEGFNIDEFMKSSFGVFQGEPTRVRIWFAADIAEYIRERTWHETQKIETQKDGSILFEAEVAGMQEIEFWVLKWGAKAKVLAPESLQDKIRTEIEAMRDMYQSL
jgi:predicted DNA-binding transcriptional regulator YafY